jgi:hypothetical protein
VTLNRRRWTVADRLEDVFVSRFGQDGVSPESSLRSDKHACDLHGPDRGSVMAAVNNVGLTIEPGATDATRKVTVKYLLGFESAEVGLPFEVRIDLFGEDKPGDDEAPSGGSKPVASFGFPFINYKVVTGHTHTVLYQETRQVSEEALNEDPGVTILHPDINTTVKVPHHDEIFARVSVAAKPVTAESATVGLWI